MSQITSELTRQLIEYNLNNLLDRGVDIVELKKVRNDMRFIEIRGRDSNGNVYTIYGNLPTHTMCPHESDAIIREFNDGMYSEKYGRARYEDETRRNIQDGRRRANNLIDRNIWK